MIVKILSEFNNLKDILSNISKNYQVIFYNNVLYLYSDDKNITQEHLQKELQNIISSSYYCVELNENNLKYEPTAVVEWCKTKFVEYDTKLFEENQQHTLTQMLKFINDFDSKVIELLGNKQ